MGKHSYVVFITMKNYTDIKDMDGAYAAEYAVSKMAQYLVRLRRQSDIIAQTGPSEYALLLQRPLQDDEPIEAAGRFATSLSECDDIVSGGSTPVEISVDLIDVRMQFTIYAYYDAPAATNAKPGLKADSLQG